MAEETDVTFAVENMYPWRAPRPGDPGLRARLGPHRRGLRPTSRSTCRTRPCRAVRRHGDGARARRPARPRAPRRRHRLGQGRAPRPGPRRRSRARGARAPGRRRLRRAPSSLEVITRRAATGPSARPTSPRRWRSPGSTSRSAPDPLRSMRSGAGPRSAEPRGTSRLQREVRSMLLVSAASRCRAAIACATAVESAPVSRSVVQPLRRRRDDATTPSAHRALVDDRAARSPSTTSARTPSTAEQAEATADAYLALARGPGRRAG